MGKAPGVASLGGREPLIVTLQSSLKSFTGQSGPLREACSEPRVCCWTWRFTPRGLAVSARTVTYSL